MSLAAAGFACSPRLPDPVPVADPGELALSLQRVGTPDQPQLIEFKWRYSGREGRFAGEGAVRVNPPDSVRLDLFGPDWSGVQSAVLLGDDVYYIGEQRVELPPPAFIWAFLGVFRPPWGLEPRGSRRGARAYLSYELSAAETVEYEFNEAGRLLKSELQVEGAALQRIEVRPGSAEGSGWSWPREARYRDLGEFHEVRITVVETRSHAPFESRIFQVAGR